MTEKDVSLEELDESMKQTDEQVNLLSWKMNGTEQQLAVPIDSQEMCVMNLLQSVSEVRSDYQNLRRELVEVQAMQRELSTRLRAQLLHVHEKFAKLRQKLAATSSR